MRWISPLVLAVLFGFTSSLAAQSTADLLSEVRRLEDRVDPGVFKQIGKHSDEEAYDALVQCSRILKQPVNFKALYLAFHFFRGEGPLEDRARAFLRDEVMAEDVYRSPYAMESLAGFEADAKAELLFILQKCKDESLCAMALEPLRPIFAQDLSKAGLELFLDHYQAGVSGNQTEALDLLNAYPPEDSFPIFESKLKGRKTSSLVQQLILKSVALVPGAKSAELLQLGLKIKDEAVQLVAVKGLAERQATDHEKQLRKLSKAKLPELRFMVYQELARLSGEEAWRKETSKLMRSKDPVQRQIAALSCASLPKAEAIEQLAKLLDDGYPGVRIQAMLVLEQLRHKEVIPLLIAQMEHDTPVVRHRLAKVLENLTGESFGPEARTWKRWWQGECESFVLPPIEEVRRRAQEREQKEARQETVGSFYGLPVISDRVIFILDTSGSMQEPYASSGKYGTKEGTRLSTAQAQLSNALKHLPEGRRFNIIFFDSFVRRWQDELVDMNRAHRAEALDFVARQRAQNTTAIYDALEMAYRDQEFDTIYLLTDGMPKDGKIEDPVLIRKAVQEWNALRHITIHCVSLGGHIPLLQHLAADSGGEFTVVR